MLLVDSIAFWHGIFILNPCIKYVVIIEDAINDNIILLPTPPEWDKGREMMMMN